MQKIKQKNVCMQKIKQKLVKHKETIKKISKIKILEYELKQHHWLMIIGGSLSIAFLILVSYFSTVKAYDASHVIGQSYNSTEVFNSNYSNNVYPNDKGLSNPVGLLVDSTNHHLFVSSFTDDRILVFNLDENNELLDRTADYILGQSSFSDYDTDDVSQTDLNVPYYMALNEASSTLFVADYSNNRVMIYDLSNGIENGMPASYVLGQTDFDSKTYSVSSSTLYGPYAVDYEADRQYLYVSDYRYHRVLVYDLSNGIENGMPASYVLGQTDFESNTSGTTQSTLYYPRGLKKDPNSVYLFVADSYNNRVLAFDTTALTDHGQSATYVIGQTGFTTKSTGNTQSTLNYPYSLDFVSNTLFVADSYNNRVLAFDTTAITNHGQPATYVIGQTGFTTKVADTTNSSLTNPKGVCYLNDKLYVADADNHRVMIFDVAEITNGEPAVDLLGQIDDAGEPVFTSNIVNNGKINASGFGNGSVLFDGINHRFYRSDSGNSRILVFDMDSNNELLDYTADHVLGQTDFISNSIGTTASTFYTQRGLAYDTVNNYLFVADDYNHRVLIFDALNLDNGEEAIYVLGQTNFTTNTSGITTSTLYYPEGLYYYAPSSTLFVTDSGNNRVVVYDLSAGIINGMDASYVLGQPNFITRTAGTTASKMSKSAFIEYDYERSHLFVSEYTNSRVLVFDLSDGIQSGESAIKVLGQSNFTTKSTTTTRSGMYYARGMAFDAEHDRLFLSDWANNRTLVYDISEITDGEDAVMLLGQASYTSGVYTPSRIGPTHGFDLALDSTGNNQRAYIPGYQYKVLIFDFVKVVSGTLEAWVVGDSYSETIISNHQGVLTSEITAGSLPPGLSLNGDTISGTPTTFGTYTFTVRATDTFDVGDFWDEEEITISVSQNLTDWQYRKKITIDHEQFPADLENYSLLVSFSTDTDLATKALENGNDLMFVGVEAEWNSGTALDRLEYQIESYDPVTGELEVWVKIPSLSSTVDTEIYLYYGNDSVSTSLQGVVTPGDEPTSAEDFYSVSPEQTQNGYNLSDWQYRKKITIDGDQVAGDLKDFTVLVSFDSDSDLVYNVASTTGGDIIFVPANEDWSSGNTNNRYAFTISSYNSTNGALSALVKIPELLASSDTEFYMYYGNDSAVDLQDDSHVEISGSGDDWTTTYNNNYNYPADFYTITPELVTSGTDLSAWNYRKKITVESDYVVGELADFPVHINLSADADLSAKANANGSDILIVPVSFDWTSDDINVRYQFEIVSYTSSTGALEAYVNIPALSDSSYTEFYIYYNNTSQTTSLEDTNTQNGSSTTTQALSAWIETSANNENEEVNFYSLSDEEFYNQDNYHLTITGTESMIPSGSQIITITLVDNSNDPALLYDGDKTVVFSGAHADSEGNQPTCTNQNNEDVSFGSDTVITFTNGAGICVLKLYKEESVSVDARAGVFSTTGGSFHDLDITVSSERQPTVSGGGGGGINMKTGGYFVVNGGSAVVSSKFISLLMKPGDGVVKMAIANDESFYGISVEEYKEKIDWILSDGDDLKNIFVKFWYKNNLVSPILSTALLLDTRPKIITPLKDQEVSNTPFNIIGIANPMSKVDVSVGGSTYTVESDEKGNFKIEVLDQLLPMNYTIKAWQYDKDGVKGNYSERKIKFVNKDMVEVVNELAKENYLGEVNSNSNISNNLSVENVIDKNVKQNLDIVINSPTKGEQKKELAKVIEKEAFLLVMQNNSVGFYKEQIDGIDAISGENIEILLRPTKKLHSAVGRLYKVSNNNNKISWWQTVKNWWQTDYVYALTQPELKELVDAYVFEYDEQYNVYRTSIELPCDIESGGYEFLINLNNQDGSQLDLKKNIKVAEKGVVQSDNNLVAFARIEVFRQNEKTGEYKKWNANLYGGKNPIFTNEKGEYTIQLPPGVYYFEVVASGYETYESKVYILSQPSVINENLVVQKMPFSWWFRFWEWLGQVIK